MRWLGFWKGVLISVISAKVVNNEHLTLLVEIIVYSKYVSKHHPIIV